MCRIRHFLILSVVYVLFPLLPHVYAVDTKTMEEINAILSPVYKVNEETGELFYFPQLFEDGSWYRIVVPTWDEINILYKKKWLRNKRLLVYWTHKSVSFNFVFRNTYDFTSIVDGGTDKTPFTGPNVNINLPHQIEEILVNDRKEQIISFIVNKEGDKIVKFYVSSKIPTMYGYFLGLPFDVTDEIQSDNIDKYRIYTGIIMQ